MPEPTLDPTDINDNPEDQVIDEPVVTDDPTVEDEPIVEDEVVEEVIEDEPAKPSRREQLRINQLLEKYGEPDAPRQRPQSTRTDGLNYEDELDADPETIKRLREDRDAYARKSYEDGVSQASSIMFQTRLEVDAPKVEAKYQFLDKNSDEFNPTVARAINNKYLQFVGFDPNNGSVKNPNIRYSDFVEAEMEFAEELANDRISSATTNITKQAARTGLRPDGSAPRKSLNLNKAPADMTDEELKAKIASFIPTK